jgi:hypothetical protein
VRPVAVLMLLVGCGRLGFDPVRDDGRRDGNTVLTYREAVLADAPVGYWRLGDAGTVAHDESGHMDGSYIGTCAHGVGGALVGDADGATRFSGHCHVSIGDQFAFPGTAAFSIEVWVASPNPGSTYLVMKESRNPANQPIDGYALVLSTAGAYSERVVNTSFSGSPTLATSPSFVHLVAVYDGTAQQMFVDGAAGLPAEPDTMALRSYTASLELGGLANGDGRLTGVLDEVAIYDHALAADRIALHHELGVTGPR